MAMHIAYAHFEGTVTLFLSKLPSYLGIQIGQL